MSFLAYQKNNFSHQHESEQYFDLCKRLKEYYGSKREMCVFISNYSINGCELDGLIIKNNAFIIVEFKSCGGKIWTSENDHWLHDGEIIRGGADKTVFEQIKTNRSGLSHYIKDKQFLPNSKRIDIGGVVVFHKPIEIIKKLEGNTDLWLKICDNTDFVEKVRSYSARDISMSDEVIVNHILPTLGLCNNDCDTTYSQLYIPNMLVEENITTSTNINDDKNITDSKNHRNNSEPEDTTKVLLENYTNLLKKYEQVIDEKKIKDVEYEKLIKEHSQLIQAKDEAEQIAFDALSENERLKKLNDSDKPSILTSNTRTRNTENNAPRLTDPMLVKAWTLSNSELTTKEIIEKSRWRPINAYERLTKLVLKGCFDAKRYMDEDTYNLVMNSIKKFGSKADVHDIQNNCGRGISLWHVNMVLAELKYNKIVIKSPAEAKPSRIVETQIKDLVVDNVTQSLFENYVVNCFRIQYRKCFTRKPSNAILKEPEIVIELTAYGKVTTFAVATWFEQKVNTTFTLEWDYLSVYRKYSRKIDGEFYFVLGKGGTPQQPKKIYILPLSIFKKDTPVNLTSTYKAENVSGSFRYDINSGKLTLE